MDELHPISWKYIYERSANVFCVCAKLALLKINTLIGLVYRHRCLNFMPFQGPFGAGDPAEEILSGGTFLEIWVLIHPGQDPGVSV
jgi:hypothetical protein